MAEGPTQGADQCIRSSLGFSFLPKDTLTCRPGELNRWPSKILALHLSHCHPSLLMDNSAEMDNVNSYNLHRHSKPTGRVPGFEASFLRGQTVEMYRHVMHYGPKAKSLSPKLTLSKSNCKTVQKIFGASQPLQNNLLDCHNLSLLVQSLEASWLYYLIPIQISLALNWKLASSSSRNV